MAILKYRKHIHTIIDMIRRDIGKIEIFRWAKSMGLTKNKSIHMFWYKMSEHISEVTGRPWTDFVPHNTSSYKKEVKSFQRRELKKLMEFFPTINNDQQIAIDSLLNKNDPKDFLTFGVGSFLESIRDLPCQKQIEKKVEAISNLLNYIRKKDVKIKIKIKELCSIFKLSQRTYNDRMKRNNAPRKIRNDSIVDDPNFNRELHRIFDVEHHGCLGHKKMTQYLNSEGIKCCSSTVRKAMKKDGLCGAEARMKKKRPHESKNTTQKHDYYFWKKEDIEKLVPGEAVSIDFSMVETKDGQLWMHGARDIRTGKIYFLTLRANQTTEVILEDYELLPKSVRYVNTDHGSGYMSNAVQDWLKTRGIKQSTGPAGQSYYNRWIEEFWKRIKGEWFSQFDIKKLPTFQIRLLMEAYLKYFNEKRIILSNGGYTPCDYEKKVLSKL